MSKVHDIIHRHSESYCNVLDIVKQLASTSAGNCIVVGEETMIDIGCKSKGENDIVKLCLKYAVDLLKIKEILITHKHQDHVNVPALAKVLLINPAIVVICNQQTYDFIMSKKPELAKYKFQILEKGEAYDLGKISNKDGVQTIDSKGTIYAIDAIHDVDVECNAYMFIPKDKDSNIRPWLYATDLTNYDNIKEMEIYNIIKDKVEWYIIETNYTTKTIINNSTDINNEKYMGEFYYHRAMETHCAYETSYLLAGASNLEEVVLIPCHKSKNNFNIGDVDYDTLDRCIKFNTPYDISNLEI